MGWNMPKNNSVQISNEMWEKIKYEYITTGISMRGIEKKYGIPFNRVKTKVDNEKWNDEREECQTKIKQKSVDLIATHHAKEQTKAFLVANKLLEKIERSVDAVEDGDTGAIKQLTGAIKDLKEIGVFRADLDRAEQMARIKKLQKEAEEEQTDMDVTITFKGDGYGV